MISREEAERLAARWAHNESVRRGYECTPMLQEAAFGWLIWTKQPATVLPQPGDGAVTVIDRETGEVTNWPPLPMPMVEELHRKHRATTAGIVRTADPVVELRRSLRLRPAPTVVAELTLHGRRHLARGAKGDQELRHHRLVRDYLDRLPPGHLVRGGERHAELIVLSDALHALDRDRASRGEPPLSEEDVRQLMGEAYVDLIHVREHGDPLNGQRAWPCESCLLAWVHFGLLPWEASAYAEPFEPPPVAEVPQPGRLPYEVAAVLAAGRWRPDETDEVLADGMIEKTVEVPGATYRHQPFPAARRALAAFPYVACSRRGPGRQHWVRCFAFDPKEVSHSADILGEFGALLGTRLFPIGTEWRSEAIFAVDEAERIFALDQAGEWFLGDNIDAAVTNLITGGPALRVRDDGTW